MLFDFKNQTRTVGTVDFQRGIDGGYYIVLAVENHIDDRADDLGYFSEFIAHCMLLILWMV